MIIARSLKHSNYTYYRPGLFTLNTMETSLKTKVQNVLLYIT